jgi:NACalpha-BTF3-like transcription factor
MEHVVRTRVPAITQEQTMSDDPKKTSQDRKLVSSQEHEIAYIMKAADVTRQKAKQAIAEAGPSRDKVMAYLQSKK